MLKPLQIFDKFLSKSKFIFAQSGSLKNWIMLQLKIKRTTWGVERGRTYPNHIFTSDEWPPHPWIPFYTSGLRLLFVKSKSSYNHGLQKYLPIFSTNLRDTSFNTALFWALLFLTDSADSGMSKPSPDVLWSTRWERIPPSGPCKYKL